MIFLQTFFHNNPPICHSLLFDQIDVVVIFLFLAVDVSEIKKKKYDIFT